MKLLKLNYRFNISFCFAEILHEILRNQAKEKLENERRYLIASSSSSRGHDFHDNFGTNSRFPINSSKDFIKFNDDLRDRNYANQVVSTIYALAKKEKYS